MNPPAVEKRRRGGVENKDNRGAEKGVQDQGPDPVSRIKTRLFRAGVAAADYQITEVL